MRLNACVGRRSVVAFCWLSLAPLAFSGCGAEGGDGPDRCELSIIVDTPTPEQNRSVSLRATSSLSGFLEVSWSLRYNSAPVDCSDDQSGLCSGETINFVPAEPGIYEISVSGSTSGLSCTDGQRDVNVRAEGALDTLYDIVVTPLPSPGGGVDGAVYRDTVNIPGGADFSFQELTLDSAIDVGGVVMSGGQSIAAHLRISPSTGGEALDVFASPTLGYSTQLPPDTFDVEVFPADAALAPVRLSGIDVTDFGALTVPPGSQITGSVTAPGGAALADARVFLTGDGLPSSIGTTTAAGAFDLSIRFGVADQQVSVSAPLGSGLPDLVGTAGGPNSSVVVDYDDALVVTPQSFSVTESDGSTAIAGARVTFVSDTIADAGTVSIDGGTSVPLDGRVRVTAVSDGAGQISNLMLASTSYSVVVSAPGASGPPTLLTRAIAGGGSSVLSMAAQPPRWSVQLVDELSTPIEGARVTLRPRGDLALVAGATQSALSGANGSVDISLAAGGGYDVQIDPGSGYGRVHRAQITALEAGETQDAGVVTIPSGQRVTGTIRRASGASANAHVALYCRSCPSVSVPIGEAVTEATGNFEITLPDSGTQ